MAQKDLTTRGEKVSYGFYFVGQNIFYILVLLFLTAFFTDIGIPALTLSILVLVVKIWDSINDPIFGGLVDKIRFKKGKFLPWVRISLLLIPLATILLFAIPSDIPLVTKIIWAAIGYILWDTAYTICDVPIFGLVTTMTNRVGERTRLMTYGRIASSVAALIVVALVPQIRLLLGGWLPTIIVLAVIATITMLPIAFKARERIHPRKGHASITLKQMVRYLIGNKFMFIFFIALLIVQATNVGNVLNIYFARHNLGDEAALTILSLAAIVPMIIAAIFIPALTKRIDKFHLYFWSLVVWILLGVLTYYVGYDNYPLFLTLLTIRSFIFGVVSVLMYMFTPDTIEYGTYKTGISASGISFSVQTFTVKMAAALSTSLGALALFFAGFVEGEGALQNAGFNEALWGYFVWVPTIGGLIALPILWFYKLRDRDVQVMARYNAGEITRDTARKQLSRKY